YTVYVDVDGGPLDVLGGRFLLGGTPVLGPIDGGLVPATGAAFQNVQVPLFAGLLGLVVYGQAVVVDTTAPNGLFRTSNGASTAFHGGVQAFFDTFDAVGNGFTGTFAIDVDGHVRGAPVTFRTFETAGIVQFPQPSATPLV